MSGNNNQSIPQAGKSAELSESQLEAFCKRLNLAHMRRIYQQVVDQAEKELVVSRLSHAAAGRRGGAPQANPFATLHAQRALSFLQDHR